MDKKTEHPHESDHLHDNNHGEKSLIKRFFRAVGPGMVAGAADDDPSGITTYSIAGAQMGTSLLWMAWFTWPLMAIVQMSCARIGLVTGQGLAGAFRKKFPKPLLLAMCVALLITNTINIAADLSGMAEAAELLTGHSSHMFVAIFGVGIGIAIVKFRYHQIADILKWMTLALFSYIAAAFTISPDWNEVAKESFTFSLPDSKLAMTTVVAILGTTISPYLFFWQASQEVEEGKALGRRMRSRHEVTGKVDMLDRIMDVGAGTLLSNLVMFFIILTTALTLNAHGITNISSSREAAIALRPIAGDFAMLLYTAGIIAVGLLAIPTLAGSAAYAFAETFDWSHGLDEKLKQARSFYGVIILSVTCGIGFDYLHINPVTSLFWSAIINGLLAPFILAGIAIVASDKKIMDGHPSSGLNIAMIWFTAVIMAAVAIGTLYLS